VRRTHRRQFATVAIGLVTIVALVVASIAGAKTLLRGSQRPIPAERPDAVQLQPLEAVPFGRSTGGPGTQARYAEWVAARSSDELWMGSTGSGGIWRLANGKWTHFEDGLPVGGGFWGGFAFTPDGAVWAAGARGVVRFDGSTWERVASGGHRAITLGPDGTPWAARWSNGAQGWVVGPVGGTPIAEPVPLPAGSTLDRLLVVSEDDVWAGSAGVWAPNGGLAHFDGSGWVEIEPITDASELSVQGVARTEDGALWADIWFRMDRTEPNGRSHALARFDGEAWTAYGEIGGVPLGTGSDGGLEIAPNGDLFLGTVEGLFRYRDGAWNQVTSGEVTSMSVAPDGTVWLWGDGGLFRIPSSTTNLGV
jgi:hypothetical protein